PNFMGAKLFPFPNRINGGEYTYRDVHYNLNKNHIAEGHAIHGLVYDRIFNFISFDESTGLLKVSYTSDGSHIGYPFLYELILEFVFLNNGITIHTIIKNIDHNAIPVGDGWHPYFKVNNSIDEIMIKIPVSNKIQLDQKMIPTGSSSLF